MKTYSLRNNGYRFLESLAMDHALHMIIGLDNETEDWKNNARKKYIDFIDQNYPLINEKALIVRDWLDQGTIVLKGNRNGEQHRRLIFTDNRTYEELNEGEKNYLAHVEKEKNKRPEQPIRKWWKIWKPFL